MNNHYNKTLRDFIFLFSNAKKGTKSAFFIFPRNLIHSAALRRMTADKLSNLLNRNKENGSSIYGLILRENGESMGSR